MSGNNLHILLVEDNPRDAYVFREALSASKDGSDHEVEHVSSLGEGLRHLATHQYDLVMLDLTLPDSRGYDTFEKAHALARSVPIILMTAVDDEELAVRAVREGAQDYLVKSQISGPLLLRAMRYAVERHRTRGELRETAEKLTRLHSKHQAMLRTTPHGLCLLNQYWTVTFANAAMHRLLGAAEEGGTEELAGMEFHSLFGNASEFEAYRKDAVEHIRVEGLHRMEVPLKTALGQTVWCDVALAPTDPDRAASGYVATISDVSARRLAEAELKRLAAAVEQASEAILITDTNWKVQYANHALEKISGYSRDEVMGQTPAVLLGSGSYDDLFRNTVEYEIKCHGTWSGRFTSRHRDGSSYEEEVTVRPLCDDSGQMLNFVLTRRDISRELSLENELRQSQKMEAVGLLAGGIAHDFNNILQVVTGTVDMLLPTLAADDPKREELERVLNAGRRGAGLTRQLLAFSRKQAMQPQLMSVNGTVQDILRMLQRLIGEDIQLHTSLDPDLAVVNADPAQIEQVLLNLALNARDAMEKGGTLAITTANVTLTEEFAREHLGVSPGPYVRLSVEDTGHGMDEPTQARIFDPFFTTKEIGKGTGLGLATAYGIVRQSGGHVYVSSDPGSGTTFDVYLPKAGNSAVLEARLVPPQSSPAVIKQTVLVVEDEPDVRELVRMLLSQAGYETLAAAGPTEAILLQQDYPDPIHLLLTDVVMPDMSGQELALQICSKRPGLKVLFMSGYTEHAVTKRKLLPPNAPLLQKPFSSADLLARIRESLSAAAEERYCVTGDAL